MNFKKYILFLLIVFSLTPVNAMDREPEADSEWKKSAHTYSKHFPDKLKPENNEKVCYNHSAIRGFSTLATYLRIYSVQRTLNEQDMTMSSLYVGSLISGTAKTLPQTHCGIDFTVVSSKQRSILLVTDITGPSTISSEDLQKTVKPLLEQFVTDYGTDNVYYVPSSEPPKVGLLERPGQESTNLSDERCIPIVKTAGIRLLPQPTFGTCREKQWLSSSWLWQTFPRFFHEVNPLRSLIEKKLKEQNEDFTCDLDEYPSKWITAYKDMTGLAAVSVTLNLDNPKLENRLADLNLNK